MKTVNIPDDLHAQFKAKTALEGLSVKTVTEDLVRLYVAGEIELPKKKKPSI